MIFLALFLLLLALAAALLVPWFLHRWLKRRGWARTAWLLPAALLLALSYPVYTAIYPTDSFYEQEFERITGRPFPASATIERKDASYPDQHGDYAACARLTVSPADYQRLLGHLRQDTAFQALGSNFRRRFIGSSTFDHVAPDLGEASAYQQAFFRAGRAFMFIGFLPDGRTLIVYRSSS